MAEPEGAPDDPDPQSGSAADRGRGGPVVRDTLRFVGRVQGVGFRATTRLIARDHRVTGHVCNEPDGTVLCVVEGERGELDRFRAAIDARLGPNIERVVATASPSTNEFDGFRISH